MGWTSCRLEAQDKGGGADTLCSLRPPLNGKGEQRHDVAAVA
jgi:hypothetical protein